MEALAAVSLAGNIVQFIDFVGEVCSKSGQIYHSASCASEEAGDQEFLTRDLKELNSRLHCPPQSPDPVLERLCSQCNGVADELLVILESFRATKSRTRSQSLRKSLKSVWGKEKVLKLERRLQTFRQELSFHILVDLRYSLATSVISMTFGS